MLKIILLITCVTFLACSESKKKVTPENDNSAQTQIQTSDQQNSTDEAQIYTVNGTVTSVPPGGKFIMINHENIPGFMRAMEMPFYLENKELASSIKPDDYVTFTFKVESGKMIITEIKKAERNN